MDEQRELVGITLDDLDWDRQVIHVMGEGGRWACLPVPRGASRLSSAMAVNLSLQYLLPARYESG